MSQRGQRVNFNQHDERNTDCEAAEATLGEEFRIPRVGGDRGGARDVRPQRLRNEPEISACVRGEFEACLE